LNIYYYKAYFKKITHVLLERNIISPFLASVFGGLIGQEKERKNWTAGMRAHMMVSSF